MTKTEIEILERIKSQMKMKGFNQTRLANCLGIKQYQVSRLLDGKPFPSIDQIFLIAANLDCSVTYLLGLREETYQELSKEAGKVAFAYVNSNKTIKEIIKRLLDIQ